MYSRKIYATGSATANAVGQITIPSRSRIVGVIWSIKFDAITDNASAVIELSKASALEIAVNAAQQCVSECCFYANFVTSGLMNGVANFYHPCDATFDQGQILYMHSLVTGTITFTGGAILWLS